jgi:glycosyltransferase involved in cell wall biosynthesis
MYHADLVAGFAGRLTGKPPIVWGLHHTVSDKNSLKASTKVVARINASLSYFIPEKVVCCAEATRLSHIALGYAPGKMMMIPNGIDPAVFRPDPAARREVRHELGLEDGTPLIGLCARFDPQKDHENFIRAAGLLHQKYPQAHFLLWGKDIVATNESVSGWLRSAGVNGVTHLLGLRQDTPRLLAALDISGLSSSSEAFPLVVGETMSCGIPCVVTDVGDSAVLVGETGRVVPRRDSAALADAWAELLSMDESQKKLIGVRSRQRIVEQYSMERMVSAYSQLYRDIIAGSGVK